MGQLPDGGCGPGATRYSEALRVALDALRRWFGMAQYNFHAMLGSLHLEDIPVGYVPPLGPQVDFQVTYNQRDGLQPPEFPLPIWGRNGPLTGSPM